MRRQSSPSSSAPGSPGIAGASSVPNSAGPPGLTVVARLWVLLAAICVSGVTGCTYLGWAAQGFATPQNKAAFDGLRQAPTLVLVDDVNLMLRDATLPNYIAAQIGVNLVHEGVLLETVPMTALNELRASYGAAFDRLPVDRVGQETGAQQVIHVNIYSVTIHDQPGVIHPTARMFVKVIDARTGERLFPPADWQDTAAGGQPMPRGFPLDVSLPKSYDVATEADLRPALFRTLSERIARDVGRLFHDYPQRQPGEPFEDY